MKYFIQIVNLFVVVNLIFSVAVYSQENSAPSPSRFHPEYVYALHNWKICAGDDSAYAKKDFADNSCPVQPIISEARSDSAFLWFRKTFLFVKAPKATDIISILAVGLPGAYEVYWDGHFIGSNGKFTENAEEYESGRIVHDFKLAPKLTGPGMHVLAFRIVNDFPRYPITKQNVYLGESSKLTEFVNRQLYVLDFMTGFNTLVVILTISLFLVGGRHRSYLYFGLYRFCFMIFAVLQIAIFRFPITMQYNDLIIAARYIFDPFAYVFLSLFIIYNFALPRKTLHLALNLLFFGLFYSLWGSDYTMLLLMYPLGMMIWAVKNKRPGAGLALFGLVVLCATSFVVFFKPMWYEMIGGNIVFVSFALLSVGRQVKAREDAFRESQLKSSRLEAQLLKKNIQPHFLMNTLLTIISLIRKKPDDAIKLIQALADEFKLINKISANKTIPIEDEIALCRKHLEIMGYRRGADYKLITDGIFDHENVPPMIFHTLIENGITHSFEPNENGAFYLTRRQLKNDIHYVLKNSGAKVDEKSRKDSEEFEEGLGTRYVKARLDESYPNHWEMTCGRSNGFWEVEIILTHMKKNGAYKK